MTMYARDISVSNSAITTVPAGSATVIIWDSTVDAAGTSLVNRRTCMDIKRALINVFMDQAATFFIDELDRQSVSTWRAVNNGGAGEGILASTFFQRDVLLIGDDNRLRIVTGTVPTVWEVGLKLSTDRALGQ